MAEFISTETVILVSFLCRKMPGLLKYILQHSGTTEKKSISSPIPLLSPQQIQDARLHPSAIAQQILRVASIIQGTLNTTQVKLNNLEKQRNNIEATLAKLRILSAKKGKN